MPTAIGGDGVKNEQVVESSCQRELRLVDGAGKGRVVSNDNEAGV